MTTARPAMSIMPFWGSVLSVSLCLCGWLAPAAAGEAPEQPAKFVVHEWGVQVRSQVVMGNPLGAWAEKGGEKKPQDLLSAPGELIADLPRFVLRHEKEFTPTTQHRAWDKPVLHFYGREGLEVSVKVLTPAGRPLAYWPRPEPVTETFWFMGSGVTDAVGMAWKGRLSAKSAGKAREIAAGHWWGTVREVPGMWFSAGADSERFIFYEASAVQEPLLAAAVDAEALTLANRHTADSGPVTVIVNDGAGRHFVTVAGVPAGKSVRLDRKEVLAAPGDAEKLLGACRAQWQSFGMTAEEARAIVETWKPDLLGRPGFLVAARMPAEFYARMFPLEIVPKPDELVRAGAVFDTLPGQPARLGWLPALEKTLEKWAGELAAEDYATREAARSRLASVGDLAEPFLKRLAAEARDAEVGASAKALLELLKPRAMTLPTHGKGSQPVNVKR